MVVIIFLLIAAAVIWWLSRLLKPTEKVTYPGTGVIKSTIYTDTGNAWYYVDFTAEDGTTYTGQSITYSSDTKTLGDGTTVPIRYYFTKAGRARVIIEDPTIVPCDKSLR